MGIFEKGNKKLDRKTAPGGTMTASAHIHSEYSKNDGGMSIKEMVSEAASRKCRFLALTDHGVGVGLMKFMEACRENGINAAPGCEFYVKLPLETLLRAVNVSFTPEQLDAVKAALPKRCHMVAFAKNHDGYKQIMKAMTKANTNQEAAGKDKFPVLEFDAVKELFANGNAVGTSACVQGIPETVLLYNEYLDDETASILNKAAGKSRTLSDGDISAYEYAVTRIEEIKEETKSISKKISEAKKMAGKSLKSLESAVEKAKGDDKKTLAIKALETGKAAKAQASKELTTLENLKAQLAAETAKCRETRDSLKADYAKAKKAQESTAIYQSVRLDENLVYEMAKESMRLLNGSFGGSFYAEVQYHGLGVEARTMPMIARMAHELGISLIAANDAHILRDDPEWIMRRSLLRGNRYGKWEEPSDSDHEMYMKSDDELAEALREILSPEDTAEAIKNLQHVGDDIKVEPDNGKHYPVWECVSGATPAEELREMALAGKEKVFPDGVSDSGQVWDDVYEKRLEHELDVIIRMGYADYHLIVQEFLEVGRKAGRMPEQRRQWLIANMEHMNAPEILSYIAEDQSEVGFEIGLGRGSAAGSLVCYLLGITDIDPIKYGLYFERFLNEERVSMPDIDSDLGDDVRGIVIEYISKKYRKADKPDGLPVCGIVTLGTQAAKNSVKNVARLLGHRDCGEKKTYMPIADAICKVIPNDPGTTLASCEKEVVAAIKTMPLRDKAMEIWSDAKLIEGRFSHFGMHAAGLIISDNGDTSDYVALMKAEDAQKVEHWVVQCDMVEAEGNGLLKMDLLGLNTLCILTEAMRLVRQNKGVVIDPHKLPFEPEVFSEIYAKGNTDGVFQFESPGMKALLKEFGPASIEDLILLNAMFRPGPLQYKDDVVAVKHGKHMPYAIPELKPILEKTYGKPIYQEQVMQIFQQLAGYSLGGADLVRRAMSKKKTDKLEKERESFLYGDTERGIEGCQARGINVEAANTLFDELMDFSRYAFNKSHAAVYTILSYYTAWMKYHYPAEFMCALINHVDFDKTPKYIDVCRTGVTWGGFPEGITVTPPDINFSADGFSVHDGKVLFGFSSIKGVASLGSQIENDRLLNGYFKSFAEFCLRIRPKKNALESLIWSGAFDSFGCSRSQLALKAEEVLTLVKTVVTKEATAQDDTKTETAKNTALKAAKEARQKLMAMEFTSAHEDLAVKLQKEHEVTGIFISGHPLDIYEETGTKISDLDMGTIASIYGIVTNLVIRKRKSDGKPMAFFDLEDRTGKIRVCVFTDMYARFRELINEGTALSINGKVSEDNEGQPQMIPERIQLLGRKKQKILLVASVFDWVNGKMRKAEEYSDADGDTLMLYDPVFGDIRATTLRVSNGIIKDPELKCSVM